MTATHTHSGPAIRREYPPTESPDWERVAKAIQTVSMPDTSLGYSEDTLDLHWRWKPERFREALRQSRGPEAAAAFDRRYAEGLHAPVATVRLDKRIALMTMPGEPFVDHALVRIYEMLGRLTDTPEDLKSR